MLRRLPTLPVLALVLGLATAACSDTDRNTPSSPSSQPGGVTATTRESSGGSPDAAAAALEDAFVNVVARVRASVVEIARPGSLGSGVVYDNRGNIVTNAHVVGDSTRFQVSFVDGRTVDASLVGSYPQNDLAVIRVPGSESLSPATFADSNAVKVGQISIAIGNPLGLESSVTEGVVSSTGRTVSSDGIVLPSMIQTSAPINPGNSGGALVDLRGEVIGIPTLAAVNPQIGQAPGIGFAIPSNTVKLIADQLIATGRVTNSGRAALGISGATAVTRSGQPAGVLVRSVEDGKPAAGAGIKVGDTITAVNGKPTPTLDELLTVLAGMAPGQEATVEVTRPDGSKQSFKLTLGTL